MHGHAANTSQPVTLTLRKGNAGDLEDVETITDQAKDGTFTWTPNEDIKEGTDYAFQISQGGQSNYSGLLKAGAPVAAASASASDSSSSDATPTSSTSASSTDSSSTTETTHITGTSRKALMSSSASATPSSSPASTTVVSSTMTGKGPMMTSTETAHGGKATATGSMQNGGASVPKYSTGLLVGAMGLLVYLIQ